MNSIHPIMRLSLSSRILNININNLISSSSTHIYRINKPNVTTSTIMKFNFTPYAISQVTTNQCKSISRLFSSSSSSTGTLDSGSITEESSSSDSESNQIGNIIKNKLMKELSIKKGDLLIIDDTSGGCGQFFRIEISCEKFENMPLVKQHRLVNQILKSEVAKIHGLTLNTLTREQAQKKYGNSNPQ